MKRPAHCGEQPLGCKAQWNFDIHVWQSQGHEMSFALRGAPGVTLHHHQIAPATKKTLMIDPCHIWNVISNARSNWSLPPTSPNTVPATKNDSHDWSSSHMKCYLQGAEQQESASNLTKDCACHKKWLSWLILFTHEMLFTRRGATGVSLQPHKILRLPEKKWLSWLILKCYLQGAEQQVSLSNITKYCACHEKWEAENRGYFSSLPGAFCMEKYNMSRSGYHSKFHQYCVCHDKWQLNFTKLRLPRQVTVELKILSQYCCVAQNRTLVLTINHLLDNIRLLHMIISIEHC